MPSSGNIVHVTSSQVSSSVPVICYTSYLSLLSWKIILCDEAKFFKNISSYWIWIVGRFISVSTTTSYWMVGPGIESHFWARFSVSVQTDPGVHPPSCTMRTESLLGVKWLGSGVDHPYTFSVTLKNSRVLYVYSSFGPTCTVVGQTLPLTFRIRIKPFPALLTISQ